MKKLYSVLVVAILASLVLAACGAGGAKANNLLDAIKQRGYILVSTDPNYEPQSFLNTEGKRPSDTKCPADALTTAEMQGFDVDVAKAIGDDLGVETCFATPSWDAITAGNWADKWDVSVGSMTITTARQKILDFSIPYYYTPAVVAVRADSGITDLAGLEGQSLCAGAATTYEQWLNHDMTGLGLARSIRLCPGSQCDRRSIGNRSGMCPGHCFRTQRFRWLRHFCHRSGCKYCRWFPSRQAWYSGLFGKSGCRLR